MTFAHLSAALLWVFLPQANDDRSVAVLAVSSDTGFVLPLDTMSRTGPVWRGEFVEVFSLGDEPWEESRRESDVEIDCDASMIRILSVRRFDQNSEVKSAVDVPSEWSPLALTFPPFSALHAIACEGMKVDNFAVKFSDAMDSIRATID